MSVVPFARGGAELPIYDLVGDRYRESRRADPVICRDLARLLRIAPGGRYLDVGCGTGNYTAELARRGGRWHGIDPSRVMLEQAAAHAPAAHAPRISWHRASAHDLPFGDAQFDGAVCTNAIHHFGDLGKAFSEIRRVIRAGRLVIFAGLTEQARNYWLWRYFPEMMRRSAPYTPAEADVIAALEAAGFGWVRRLPFWVEHDTADLFLYAGKMRPEIYFDAAVRANITSFRLCRPRELARGLAQLESDLRAGRFESVRRSYDDWGGDYSYLVADSHPQAA
jgi:ubiquinone/menaquinone biosynthesis C-methylase UbiE